MINATTTIETGEDVRSAVIFSGKKKISIIKEKISAPGPGKVLVQTLISAISAGTELMIYRGSAPQNAIADNEIAELNHYFKFPMKYGYSLIGQVVSVGRGVSDEWTGRRVFAYHPHESMFIADPDELNPIPDDITTEDAVFLANSETAVNLVMDACPIVGEIVLIMGQGIVGLLVTGLLAQFPLSRLVTVDPVAIRRDKSVSLGANYSIDPSNAGHEDDIHAKSEDPHSDNKADLAFELSGNIEALMQSINFVGYDGRIVIGSWYKDKLVNHNFGIDFHRSRIKLITSQVSTIASQFGGRWNKKRRLSVAWELIRKLRPSGLISHRFPFTQAKDAFKLLDEHPEKALQVILTY